MVKYMYMFSILIRLYLFLVIEHYKKTKTLCFDDTLLANFAYIVPDNKELNIKWYKFYAIFPRKIDNNSYYFETIFRRINPELLNMLNNTNEIKYIKLWSYGTILDIIANKHD